jgi:hypothetical protein
MLESLPEDDLKAIHDMIILFKRLGQMKLGSYNL